MCLSAQDPDTYRLIAKLLAEFRVGDRDQSFNAIDKVCSVGYIDERLIAAYKNVNALLPRVRSGELPLEELEKIKPERPQIEAP